MVLLINLVGAAWVGWRFVRGRTGVARIERWQTDYLPLLAGWAAIVVIAFQPLFGFV